MMGKIVYTGKLIEILCELSIEYTIHHITSLLTQWGFRGKQQFN